MEEKNKLALVVAYYLSKYDDLALDKLKYRTFSSAFKEIGQKLEVKPNTIKNMRDEFDAVHNNSRKGWYQRPLRPSRINVIDQFHHLSELDLRTIVEAIINEENLRDSNLFVEITENITEANIQKNEKSYNSRGVTGKSAEEYFIEYFNGLNNPDSIKLVDTRDQGCGYDFKINTTEGTYFVEVKGLSGVEGGLLFTNKEWETARELNEKYYLALVSNVSDEASIHFVQDPSNKLVASIDIARIIQIGWNVNSTQVKSIVSKNIT